MSLRVKAFICSGVICLVMVTVCQAQTNVQQTGCWDFFVHKDISPDYQKFLKEQGTANMSCKELSAALQNILINKDSVSREVLFNPLMYFLRMLEIGCDEYRKDLFNFIRLMGKVASENERFIFSIILLTCRGEPESLPFVAELLTVEEDSTESNAFYVYSNAFYYLSDTMPPECGLKKYKKLFLEKLDIQTRREVRDHVLRFLKENPLVFIRISDKPFYGRFIFR